MTGFGRSVVTGSEFKLVVEAKSLNSKQLDLSLRMPPMYREAEMHIREMIAKRLERGKIDINVNLEPVSNDSGKVQLQSELNINVVRAIKQQIEEVASQLSINPPQDWFSLFMRFPEVIHSDKAQPIATEDELNTLEQAMGECVENLIDFRKKEGSKLQEFLETRISNIRNLLSEIHQHETERVAKVKDRLTENLSRLQHVEYDKVRLEQELIFYIEKLDVSEEKQRLAQHLDYFADTINQDAAGKGKKLGFIAQEIGREINTLGSKSNHAEMQKIVVKMKDELEQIKEQVLNVL